MLNNKPNELEYGAQISSVKNLELEPQSMATVVG